VSDATPTATSRVETRPLPRHWVVIEPPKGFGKGYARELWAYRELFAFLTWRDIQVRYKQTAIGVTWAIIQPFLTMIVFSLFFGRLAKMPSEGVPYPLFNFAGLLPWTLFSQGVARSSESLVGSANLITKVYFPRMVAPVSAILACLVDYGLSMLVLGGMMLFYGVGLTVKALVLVPLIAQALIATVGIGLILAAMNVHYRDVRYAVPFLVQIGLFVTPVVYPATLLPARWLALYGLNPMTGVVEGCRWALLGTSAPNTGLMVLSAVSSVVLLLAGTLYFRRMERSFADVV
jgi:lipopolysaccharide transport system permease protein